MQLSWSTLKTSRLRQRLSHWGSCIRSSEMERINFVSISWEISCVLVLTFRTIILRRFHRQGQLCSSHWLLPVARWFMDGMQCVDTCRRKSSLIYTVIFHLMRDIQIWNTKKLLSFERLFLSCMKRKVWLASSDLLATIARNIEPTRSRCISAILRYMGT